MVVFVSELITSNTLKTRPEQAKTRAENTVKKRMAIATVNLHGLRNKEKDVMRVYKMGGGGGGGEEVENVVVLTEIIHRG